VPGAGRSFEVAPGSGSKSSTTTSSGRSLAVGMINELGLGDALHWHKPVTTVFVGDRAYPLDSAPAVLNFSPLSVPNRLRLARGLGCSGCCRLPVARESDGGALDAPSDGGRRMRRSGSRSCGQIGRPPRRSRWPGCGQGSIANAASATCTAGSTRLPGAEQAGDRARGTIVYGAAASSIAVATTGSKSGTSTAA